jgi:hypothetical protein
VLAEFWRNRDALGYSCPLFRHQPEGQEPFIPQPHEFIMRHQPFSALAAPTRLFLPPESPLATPFADGVFGPVQELGDLERHVHWRGYSYEQIIGVIRDAQGGGNDDLFPPSAARTLPSPGQIVGKEKGIAENGQVYGHDVTGSKGIKRR